MNAPRKYNTTKMDAPDYLLAILSHYSSKSDGSCLVCLPSIALLRPDCLIKPRHSSLSRPAPTPGYGGFRVGAAGPDGGRLQLWRRTRARGLHGGVVVMQEAGSMAEFPNVAGLHDLWL